MSIQKKGSNEKYTGRKFRQRIGSYEVAVSYQALEKIYSPLWSSLMVLILLFETGLNNVQHEIRLEICHVQGKDDHTRYCLSGIKNFFQDKLITIKKGLSENPYLNRVRVGKNGKKWSNQMNNTLRLNSSNQS